MAKRSDKEIIPVPPHGYCYVHECLITCYHIEKARDERLTAKPMVHPEVSPSNQETADYIGSTSQMVRAVGSLNAEEYVIGTEVGLLHKIRKEYPSKKAYPATLEAVCEDMKKITLEKILRALLEEKYVVAVDKKIADKARSALERSFELLGVEIPWSRK